MGDERDSTKRQDGGTAWGPTGSESHLFLTALNVSQPQTQQPRPGVYADCLGAQRSPVSRSSTGNAPKLERA